MAGVWKRDGTVAVTNGNKKVTGTGTTFADTKNGVAKGHLFCITSGTSVDFYEVDYAVSNTELYLVQAYRGVTATGKAYEIITTFSDSVPEFARRLTATLSAYQQQSDAFQALLTSTATTVEVTAPDGTKQTLIPWKRVTSEGEGQAARAKTEADKAAASAALAGDIVAASALPLPDVWAPLSDSLRLITGYGREVKVGEDVVARMVNFSRSTTRTYTAKDGTLKIAAINEPCFEKEGLHLDVQSTNLVIWSEDTTKWVKNASPTLERLAGVYSKITPTAGSSGLYLAGVSLIPGRTYTLSFWGYADAAASVRIGLENEPSSAALITSLTTTPTRHVKTFVATQSGGPLIAYGGYGGANTPFYVGGFQIEELPWASSYIPTSGAAAIRAADLLQFVGPGNHPDILSGVPFTLAVRMSCEEAASGAMRDMVLCPNISYGLLRRATNTIRYYRDGSGQLSVNAPAKTVNVVAVRVSAGNVCTLRVGSNQASRTEVPLSGGKVSTINITNVAGHVRDFRIWQHSLTDEQLKAIA